MAVTEVSYNVFDITSTQSDVVLLSHNSNRGNIKSISISNQHASTDATLDFYLDDEVGAGNNIYLIKNLKIPAGVAVVLDKVSFDNNIYSLKFTNSGGAPLSIIIR